MNNGDSYTLDEIAELVGMTPRNIRAHQTRGLLPLPVPHGRTVRYEWQHVVRLRLIGELQRRGFNLEAIQLMLERSESFAATMLQHRDALRGSGDEASLSVVLNDDVAYSEAGMDLVRAIDPDLPDRLAEFGLIRRLPDGSYRGSGSLAAAAIALNRAGVDLGTANVHLLAVMDAAERLASGLVEALVEAAGPTDPHQTVDAQTPLAVQYYAIAFEIAFGRAVERAVIKEVGS